MTEEKRYPAKACGSHTTRGVPTASPSDTIRNVEHELSERINEFATLNYIYVLDGKKLAGVISIKELFRSPQSAKLSDIMLTNLVIARPYTTLERAALMALKAGIKAVPVTDKDGVFMGVISADSVQEILHNEAVEDALLEAGIVKPETALLKASPAVHFRRRIPWLLVGLFGGLLAAGVVTLYEHALEEEILLASFIPMVVYLADAAGSQTQTLYIRSVVLDAKLDLKAYIKREVQVVSRLSVALALVIGLVSFLWWSHPALGITLGISIFLTMFVSTAVALFLPWFFMKRNIDPAIASGPFATLIRDITNLFIYFSVASVVLAFF